MDTVIMFDVNETLLDLAPVRDWFSQRYVDEPTAAEWFAELLRLSFVSSVTDRYEPFTDLAGAALETVSRRYGVPVAPENLAAIKGILATLPPHNDVVQGLTDLGNAGFTLAALTNSPMATATAQLDNAGIADFFDTVMSVDMVQRFKPHRSVYLQAATNLATAPSDIVMVAAHDWDIAGALSAGLDGIFIERPGQQYSPAFAAPTLIAQDIAAAATPIIDRYA
ncbi:MAG: haloacid dehalogenase type II [Actinomycetota bacterium]